MARFYADENFPFPVVQELENLGHSVLTIQETGMGDQSVSDEAVLASAADENRIVLTLNRKHFIHLHHQQIDHSGIIVCTFDPDFIALAHRVHTAVEEQPELAGKLVRVNRPAI